MMELRESDYLEIASLIEVGEHTLIYQKGDDVLEIEYFYEEKGYYENDYYNGTGAFVVTEQYFSVKSVSSTSENNFDSNKLSKMIYSF